MEKQEAAAAEAEQADRPLQSEKSLSGRQKFSSLPLEKHSGRIILTSRFLNSSTMFSDRFLDIRQEASKSGGRA